MLLARQNRAIIKVLRSDILDAPSSKPSLKPEVRRRLDEIASHTFAHIAVVNSTVALSTRSLPDGVSSNAGWSGLETERVCELQITGQGDSVELARVRLLVMLDEVVGCAALLWIVTAAYVCFLRVAYMQSHARSTRRCMPLWRDASEASCKRSWRRRLRTFICRLLCKVSSGLTSVSRRTHPRMRHRISSIRTLYGLQASSLAYNGLATCSSRCL